MSLERKAPERKQEDLKSPAEIFREIRNAQPGTRLPGRYTLAGPPDSPLTYAFGLDDSGVFYAEEEGGGEGASYTYFGLRDRMKELGASGFRQKQEELKRSSPLLLRKTESRGDRMRAEVKNSIGAYMNMVREMQHEPKFAQRADRIVAEIQLLHRFSELKRGESETKAEGGMMLLQAKTLPQVFGAGSGSERRPVDTLVIRLLQKTQLITESQYVTELGRPQIEILAAIMLHMEKFEKEDSNFLHLLRSRLIEQVRLEVLSWRERAGEKYSVTVPLYSAEIPPRQGE